MGKLVLELLVALLEVDLVIQAREIQEQGLQALELEILVAEPRVLQAQLNRSLGLGGDGTCLSRKVCVLKKYKYCNILVEGKFHFSWSYKKIIVLCFLFFK